MINFVVPAAVSYCAAHPLVCACRPSILADAQHIAAATVHRADILVSWNFKHIVNLRRIHGFNSLNLREEYPLLEIRTPREVVLYE